MTAFRATYSDWKVVKGRKVIQVVLELPLEAADQAYQVLGGMPMAANEIWCAVARLRENAHGLEQGHRNAESSDELLHRAGELLGDQKRLSRAGQAISPECGHSINPVERTKVGDGEQVDKPKKSPAQIAGYLCTTMAFYRFLKEKFQEQLDLCDAPTYREAAAQCVRIICNVDSRADIKPDSTEWLTLMLAYQLWQNHPELEDA